MVKKLVEQPELVPSYPQYQPWHPHTRVEWINRSEPHLQKAGLVAVGLHNGAVFLASVAQKIEVGDNVKVTEVKFAFPDSRGAHTTHIVSRI